VSGHGKREAILKSDARSWRDRVYADIAAEAGQLAMIEHRLLAPRRAMHRPNRATDCREEEQDSG
jgi:hypothetical protein